MPSSVPATKGALLALLEAHAWPDHTPDLRWGGPTNLDDYAQGGEIVYLGEVREYDDEPRTLGGDAYTETYGVPIYVDVAQYGDDERSTEERAWELVSEIRQLLHAIPGDLIQDPGVMQVMLDGRSTQPANVPMPEQWLVRLIVTQNVTAVVFNQ